VVGIAAAALVPTARAARAAPAKPKPVIGQLVLEGGPPAPITAFSWEVTAPSSWTQGGGASVGKPNPGAIRFTKKIDSTSITSFRKITAGTAVSSAVFTLRFGKGADAATMVYEMEGLFVTSVTQSAVDGVTLEEVSFVFKSVTWTFTDAAGNESSGGWDVPSGTVS
jgi:type VI protein secretion system component Hcp